MTRSLRAPAVILAGVLATIVVLTPGPRSDAATGVAALSTHDLQVTPIGTGNQPSGDSRLSVVMDPGASLQRSFVIANRTSGLRLTVRLATVDATADANGIVTFGEKASPSGAASWLTLSDVVATLEPKAELRVSLKITPPGNADPGSVFAGVVARVDRSVRMADGADGPKGDPISLPVAIDVKGAPTALVSVVGVNAIKDHDRSYLEVTFQNGGATANTMAGTLNVLGSHPKSFALRADVAPLTHTTERVAYDMPSGTKTVPVAVDTQDAGGNQAAWSGKAGFDTASTHATAAPKAANTKPASPARGAHGGLLPRALTMLVALALVAGAVWFGAEVRRSRRTRGPRDSDRVRRARRIRVAKVTPIPMPVAAPLFDPGAAAPRRGAPAPVAASAPVTSDAIAAQLGALVHAIDRLVSRLGEVLPGAAHPPPTARPDVAAGPAVDGVVARAESGAILYAAAAPEPQRLAFDPYDWPTEAQLDEFIAKRKTGPTDPR